MLDESLEREVKKASRMNKAWNKGRPSHQHRPTDIKKLRKIGRKILQEMDKQKK